MSYHVPPRPQELALTIGAADLAGVPDGELTYDVQADLPVGARFAGATLGEDLTGFDDPVNSVWTATLTVPAAPTDVVLSEEVQAGTLAALPALANSGFFADVGENTVLLRIEIAAAPRPAVITSATVLGDLTFAPGGTLDGLTLVGVQSNTGGPVLVTFADPVDEADVVSQMNTAIGGAWAVADLDGEGHLRITSQGTGPTATMTIAGGTALAAFPGGFGITAGTVEGDDGPGVHTATAGSVNAKVFWW